MSHHCSFPPPHLSDLVVHYKDVHFYLHAVVLHRHSEWFATVCAMLSDDKDPECEHNHVGQCVTVPTITTGEGEISPGAMELVFLWMYFPRWGTTMPYSMKDERDADAELHDEELCKKWAQPWLTVVASKKLRLINEQGNVSCCTAAFSLLSYWRCEALLARCHDMFRCVSRHFGASNFCFWLSFCQNGVHSAIEQHCIAQLRRAKHKGKHRDSVWFKDLSAATVAKLEGPTTRKRKR
jgi:hypothetical protein